MPAVKREYIKVWFVDRFCDKRHIYNARGEMMVADNLPSLLSAPMLTLTLACSEIDEIQKGITKKSMCR